MIISSFLSLAKEPIYFLHNLCSTFQGPITIIVTINEIKNVCPLMLSSPILNRNIIQFYEFVTTLHFSLHTNQFNDSFTSLRNLCRVRIYIKIRENRWWKLRKVVYCGPCSRNIQRSRRSKAVELQEQVMVQSLVVAWNIGLWIVVTLRGIFSFKIPFPFINLN